MSDDLIARYKAMAADGLNFHGLSVLQHRQQIGKLIRRHDVKTLLDYGCGRGDPYKSPHKIWHEWGLKRPDVQLYDPAFPERAHEPRPADMVICSDVLEHIPEDEVKDFIDKLAYLGRKVLWASVCCRPAKKCFPGTDINLHVTVKPYDWWLAQLAFAHLEVVVVETP